MPELYTTSLFSDANLVSYWRMEGNSNDSKGTNNGTDTAITYSTGNGKFGQGAGFDGSTSMIRNTAPTGFPTGATVRSVVAWVYCNAGTVNYKQVFDYGTNVSHQRFSLGLDNTNPGKFSIYTYGDDYTSPNSVTLNTWTHFAATYDGNVTIKIYVNGGLDGTYTLAAALNTVLSATGVSMGHDNTTDNFWPGNLDDIAIFSRVLTQAEIQSLALIKSGFLPFF